MQIEHARELKQLALRKATTDDWGRSLIRSSGLRTLMTERLPSGVEPDPQLAVGIAPTSNGAGYRLAIRVHNLGPATIKATEALRQLARGEVDVRAVGRIRAAASGAPLGSRCNPLRIGASFAHYRFTAGTLGAFTRSKGDSDEAPPLLLSNNHVLSYLNRDRPGDPTVHPSPTDGGLNPTDTVAGFNRYKKLSPRGNEVDCAVATLAEKISYDPRTVPGLGVLGGVATYPVVEGSRVHKVGRTSGLTHGRITAIEMDNIGATYQSGSHSFDGQIEVEGLEDEPFARPGDSGSLVVDSDVLAVGLLFAISRTGGSNGKGLSYINPIQKVLDSLDIRLIF